MASSRCAAKSDSRGHQRAARGGHVQVVVAGHAQRHAARLGLREFGDHLGGPVRDLLLQVEALHLEVGGERVQHDLLRGRDHGFVIGLVGGLGGALRGVERAAVEQAHACLGGEHGVALRPRALLAAVVVARGGADLETRVARLPGGVDAKAAGAGRGLRGLHLGVVLRQHDERLLDLRGVAGRAQRQRGQPARERQRAGRFLRSLLGRRSVLRVRSGLRESGWRQREARAQCCADHAGAHAAPVDRGALLHGSRKASRRSLSTGRRMYQMNGSVPTRRSTSDSMPAVMRFSVRPTCDCDMLMSRR